MTQDKMPVNSLAAPIVAVLAMAALIFGLVRLFAPLCSHFPCHTLLFCRFKYISFALFVYLSQGLVYIVAMPEQLYGLTLRHDRLSAVRRH